MCMLSSPQAIVDFKWKSFAQRLLLGQLCTYCCWLLAFSGFALVYDNHDAEADDKQLLSCFHVGGVEPGSTGAARMHCALTRVQTRLHLRRT